MKKISKEKMAKVNKIKEALGDDYSDYIENAVNDILYAIYRTSETNEQYERMIDKIGKYT